MENYRMELTQEEKEILQGKQGEVMVKVLKPIVVYGEAFGAKRLLPIKNPIHVVTGMSMTGLNAYYDMLDMLIHGGLKTKEPFTIDLRPFDFENVVYIEFG
ncbi:aconitase X [Bacteroides sedimenti]|uniref:Phosphomevalonate dehydratase large subunit-like domain-containing protein n=1 Tax=Bacteroides sedimenti TaxID=2136147 RepID=A0ABN6Z4E7_9BACE